MALSADPLFIDSFDHYARGEALQKWSTGSIATMIAGRFGGQAAWASNLALITAAAETWVFGFAYKTNGNGLTSTALVLRDGVSDQVSLQLLSSGKWRIHRGSIGGTAIATGTAIMQGATWYWIEFAVQIGNSGAAYLYIDGVQDIAVTAVDTQDTANASADSFALYPSGSWQPAYDDLYCRNGSGALSIPTDFYGESRIIPLRPDADGTYSAWTPSAGTDHFALVDDNIPDGLTTSISTQTATNKDSYDLPALDGSITTVHAVQAVGVMQQAGGSARTASLMQKIGVSEVFSAAPFSLSTSWLAYRLPKATKPGGGAWTPSDVNALEVGVRLDS